MKRLLLLIVISFLFLFVSVGTASALETVPIKTPESVNSYELFWPIVPGKVMGDSLYALKLFKEKVRGMIILSSFKKADYIITISEKRLVETEYLYKSGKLEYARKTLEKAIANWRKAGELIVKAKAEGVETVNLQSRFASSLEKQSMVLQTLSAKLADSEKTDLISAIQKAKELILQYK